MRKISRSALVKYSVGEMFSLVDDIESYPEFLPWCRDAVIHFRQGNVVEATLELHRGSVSKHFRTRNTSRAGKEIDIALVGGPFRHLAGGWKFTQLGDSGCKVALELEFEFANRVVDLMFGSFFEEICNTLIDAFTRRADVTFGETRGAND